ncbi:MAG: type I-C CRISPR-associated protein Cas7/Csd2 [Fimbriimonadales bacterium]
MKINPQALYCDPTKRHDFVLLFDVKDGNPNGDPDAGNLPRVDPETMHGLVTDVCLKRKVRNYIDLLYGSGFNPMDYNENGRGYGIFVRDSGVALNAKIASAGEAVGAQKQKKVGNPEVRAELCKRYYDVRMFGAVLSTGDINAGQVRGPVQITFARSLDPIAPLELTITRVAITKEEQTARGQKQAESAENAQEAKLKETEIGRKPFVPYALYRAHGFFSPALASDTGIEAQDLALFWEAVMNMWEHDRSASRGMMACRGLYVFSHDNGLGNAHAHHLFERVQVVRTNGNSIPRAFTDYQVLVNDTDLPEGITLTRLVDG